MSRAGLDVTTLRRRPNALAPHYSRFAVADRLALTGHSHQAWPDAALDGHVRAFDDAARLGDRKWERALAVRDDVAARIATLLGDPGGDVALGASTFELVTRMLSALDLRARPRLVTTDGEFHTLRRLLARAAEAGVEVTWVRRDPVDTLVDRLTDALDGRVAAVLTSAVLFEDARVVPGLAGLASAAERFGVELVVDAYHAIGNMPFTVGGHALESAWIVGGGYKYLQLGEGNCFMRLPPQAQALRPVLTGWYAEFGALDAPSAPGRVAYAPGGARFAGATYDPTSHYRAAAVLDFFAERGLTPAALRASYLHQVELLAERFDALDLPERAVTRDRDVPSDRRGAFLALRCGEVDAGRLVAALEEREVLVDRRGAHVRLGPAPYLADEQLEEAVARLGDAVRALLGGGRGGGAKGAGVAAR